MSKISTADSAIGHSLPQRGRFRSVRNILALSWARMQSLLQLLREVGHSLRCRGRTSSCWHRMTSPQKAWSTILRTLCCILAPSCARSTSTTAMSTLPRSRCCWCDLVSPLHFKQSSLTKTSSQLCGTVSIGSPQGHLSLGLFKAPAQISLTTRWLSTYR